MGPLATLAQPLLALQVDWTIQVSDLIVAVSAIVSMCGSMFFLWHKIDRRLGAAEQTIEEHVLPTIQAHTVAMRDHDRQLSDVMRQVAQLVGQLNPLPWLDPNRLPK
jgi:hypothetical protein